MILKCDCDIRSHTSAYSAFPKSIPSLSRRTSERHALLTEPFSYNAQKLPKLLSLANLKPAGHTSTLNLSHALATSSSSTCPAQNPPGPDPQPLHALHESVADDVDSALRTTPGWTLT